MSRRPKVKHLTPEELKSKLFTHFEKNGSLELLRTELRGRLISELFKVAEPISIDSFPSAFDVNKCLLPFQICNWLVYDHLCKQGYEYTLSTFVTEANLPYPDKVLTAGDVLGLLGLHNLTNEFQKIIDLYSENSELGCLHSLLLAIIKVLFDVPSLDSKSVKMKDQKNEHDCVQNTDVNSVTKVSRPTDGSFGLESKNFIFNKQVKSLEKSFYDQLQDVKEENEKEVQKLRHRLLEELEKLYAQERKRHLEIEQTKNDVKKEHDSLCQEREILKEKELLLEKELANKFEIKHHDIEVEYASKMHVKNKLIEELQKKVYEKEKNLMAVEYELTLQKESYSIMKRELDDLRHMHKIMQDKYALVLDENTNIFKKYENMSDYSLLKEELSAKSREVIHLKNELKNFQESFEKEKRKFLDTVRSLEHELNSKESQLVQTRNELDDVRNVYYKEKNIWLNEKKKLEQEIQEFKRQYKVVLQKLEEQDGNIQDLHKTTNVLYYNYSKQKSGNLLNVKTIEDKPRTSVKFNPHNLFGKSNFFPEYKQTNEPSVDFMLDAKNRLNKLIQEENDVQKKYSFISSEIPLKTEFLDFGKILPTSVTNYNLLQPYQYCKNVPNRFWSRSKFHNSMPYLASKQAMHINIENSDHTYNDISLNANQMKMFYPKEGGFDNSKSFLTSFDNNRTQIAEKPDTHIDSSAINYNNQKHSFIPSIADKENEIDVCDPNTLHFASFLKKIGDNSSSTTNNETTRQLAEIRKDSSESKAENFPGISVQDSATTHSSTKKLDNLKETSPQNYEADSLNVFNKKDALEQTKTLCDTNHKGKNGTDNSSHLVENGSTNFEIKETVLSNTSNLIPDAQSEIIDPTDELEKSDNDQSAVLVNRTNLEESNNRNRETKKDNSDSASELSEVHFSCGSEQGKEDSDAW